jgi:hypothetical protein
MVHLVRLNGGNDFHQAGITFERGSMQVHPVNEVLNARQAVLRIFNGYATNNAMDVVIFFQQQFGEVAAILARDPGNERAFSIGQLTALVNTPRVSKALSRRVRQNLGQCSTAKNRLLRTGKAE